LVMSRRLAHPVSSSGEWVTSYFDDE
jgi:hypothetical protein